MDYNEEDYVDLEEGYGEPVNVKEDLELPEAPEAPEAKPVIRKRVKRNRTVSKEKPAKVEEKPVEPEQPQFDGIWQPHIEVNYNKFDNVTNRGETITTNQATRLILNKVERIEQMLFTLFGSQQQKTDGK